MDKRDEWFWMACTSGTLERKLMQKLTDAFMDVQMQYNQHVSGRLNGWSEVDPVELYEEWIERMKPKGITE